MRHTKNSKTFKKLAPATKSKVAPLIRCPVCTTKVKIYASKEQTLQLREHWCMCQNVFCGHTFVSYTQFDRTISPSALTVSATEHPNLRYGAAGA